MHYCTLNKVHAVEKLVECDVGMSGFYKFPLKPFVDSP